MEETYDPRTVTTITEEQLAALNPPLFDIRNSQARFFVIKPEYEDDVHYAVKYGVWSSSSVNNEHLSSIIYEGHFAVMLFFSVVKSSQFIGVAQMMSPYFPDATYEGWSQAKLGSFKLSWLYVKDLHNSSLRHIAFDNGRLVTACKDGEEIPRSQGCALLKEFRDQPLSTSLLQDFAHYDAKEAEWARYRAQQLA